MKRRARGVDDFAEDTMNDPLFGNKAAAAVLSALLLIVGLPVVAHSVYAGSSHGGGHGGDHGGKEAQVFPQYPVELDFGPSIVVETKVADLGTMMASAETARGEKGVRACASCHSFNEGGPHLQGPNLWNVIGRPIASAEGYGAYSSALKGKGGVWTYEAMSAFLYNSQEYAPGTAMNQKIKKDAKRADILAYLGSLSADPIPFPEPAPAEPEAPSADPAGE
ncbi:MAG: c-type cytochrome [Pseudomonadota bacterium]